MPNLKGGKKYKSGKHSDLKPEFHEIDKGQMAARVLKHLGDRNILVYCNDGKERIAHIRGGLSKKKALIEVGDVVLISLRSSEMVTESATQDRGDVLAKYSRDVWNQLKKVPGINMNMFLQVETMDRTKIKKDGCEDDGFEFEVDAEDAVLSSEESGDDTKASRDAAHKLEEKKRSAARDIKQSTVDNANDDVDIDAI